MAGDINSLNLLVLFPAADMFSCSPILFIFPAAALSSCYSLLFIFTAAAISICSPLLFIHPAAAMSLCSSLLFIFPAASLFSCSPFSLYSLLLLCLPCSSLLYIPCCCYILLFSPSLFVPRLFEEKRRDIVFGIPSFRPSVLPSP